MLADDDCETSGFEGSSKSLKMFCDFKKVVCEFRDSV